MPSRAGVILVVTVGVAVGRAAAEEPPNLNDPDRIAAGRQLSTKSNALIGVDPASTGAIRPAGRSDLEPKYVFATISGGRVDGALRMPSWRGVLSASPAPGRPIMARRSASVGRHRTSVNSSLPDEAATSDGASISKRYHWRVDG